MQTVKVRQVRYYGRLAFYPVSDSAKLFCQLIKRSGGGENVAKSLTESQLGVIKQLGHTVEIEAEQVKAVEI